MLVEQKRLTNLIKRLLDRGQPDVVTFDDLTALVPEPEESIDLLDALLNELSLRGIEVRDQPKAEEPEETEESSKAEVQESDDNGWNLDHIPADDLLSVYLAQQGQEPLLSYDEEVSLARQIESGRQAEQALLETDYNASEYDQLQAQAIVGQEARERLAEANTRLVVSIAKRYRNYGLPFSDLIQEGNVGLMRAVDRYDPESGNRFSTYATWWIRQAVTRSLANHGRMIRIPVHTGARIREMVLVSQRLEMEHGRRPTAEEIAEEMEESPYRVRQMMRWSRQPVSLEQPVGEEEDAELGDFIEDDQILQPDIVTDQNLLTETLDTLLAELSVREARILRLRYGLEDGQTRTLNEVAQKFGLSRERIRQIEREALTKLRMTGQRHGLEGFIGE